MYQYLVKTCLIMTLFSAVLTAGQTGKITGKVLDQETGNPLPGVNVLLENTPMGAATDPEGKFVILDIPPGLYTVKLSFIGYATITIENVRSTTDLTTNLYTINMAPEAIEGETITVTAEKPLLEVNATNEVHVVRAEDIKNLPVRGYANVVALQTSVVDDGGTLHIRGGRSEEVGYYVDGVSAVDPYSLTRRGSIPNISIEEVSFQAGGFGAEYGAAGAGIVNTTTKTGGNRLAVTGEFLTDIGATEPSEDKDKLYSYGYNLYSAGLGGPIPGLDFIKFYGAIEYIGQDDSPTAGSFPVYNKDLNIANARPENGDPFTDNNGNTTWDAGESYTDEDGDGAYTAPSYLRVGDDDIDFVYGPRADNWYNRLNANWNLLVDLPNAMRLKVGGTYFDSHSSNYSHYRSLFSFYNDASTMDGTSSAGSLTHRYSQSESTINNVYARLSGAVPGFDQMFFTAQYSHGSIKDNSYDPVTKEGWGNFVYEDGTISDIEVPYIQGGKWYDLGGTPTWVYVDASGNEVERTEWDFDPSLTFVQINYDTTYINPLNRATGSGPVPYVEIANYGVAGLNSGYTGIYKAEKLRDEVKANLLWQLGDHEIKIGGNLERGEIKRYSVSGSWAAIGFNSNKPYSEDGDRWEWDPYYLNGAGALVWGADGIPDFAQDPSDTYEGEITSDDTTYTYEGYWDDYLYQTFKAAYADNVGYDVTGVGLAEMQPINQARTPTTMAAYFQDKFELDDLILNVGLRYDFIDPANKVFNPLTGGNQNIIIDSEGYLAETVYWNDVDDDGIKGPREYTSAIPTGNDSVGLAHQVDVTPSAQLSPRIGIGFPITDRTAFHATYGKYLQAARWDNLYISWNRFLSNIQQGNYTRSANPELQPTKTTEYEIGFKQLVTDDISIDMTLFYTEKKDFIQIRNVAASPTGYALYSNGDFSTVKGMAFSLRTRRLGNAKLDANYTLSYGGGTGSNADTGTRISWLGGNDPTFTSPLNYDQRHTANIVLDYRTGNRGRLKLFGANILFRYGSGMRYTPSKPRTAVFGGQLSDQPVAALNSGTMPATFNIDLRLDKTFMVNNISLGVFCVVKNALNNNSVQSVYNFSGLPNNDGYLTTQAGQNWVNDYSIGSAALGEQLYTSRITSPGRYGSPRQVQIGLRVDL